MRRLTCHIKATKLSLQLINTPPTLMGEGTNFNLYLTALSAGLVVFDPASKVMNASTLKSTVKARSQFRMPVKKLSNLYQKFEAVDY